jgi:signal peptidase I
VVATLVVSAVVVIFLTTNHAYVSTPSMYPTIKPGSMVFIEKQRDYHVGEVVEFKANGLLWVHRIIRIAPNGTFTTKGDNPQSVPDVFRPQTTAKDVVGSVVLSVPFLGFPELIANSPSYGLSWLRAEFGFAGRVAAVGVVAGLGLFAVRRRRPPLVAHRKA